MLLFDLIWNQTNYLKFLNTYLNVIYARKGLCFSKKMWLSAPLLLTMVLTFDSSWSPLDHYGLPSTGRVEQLAYTTKHK